MKMDLPGLVISRELGQSVWIGDKIRVTVVRLCDGQVRLHIAAPKELNILREELKERKTPIHAGPGQVIDIGRRSTDEAANGFVPPGACVIPDEV